MSNMKKFLMILVLVSVFSTFLVAAENEDNKKTNASYEKTEGKWSSYYYVNVPILKILEGKNAYSIIYQKKGVGVGSVVIPKKWAKGTPEDPRKLKFRKVRSSINSFMTIVKDDGEFKRVILSIPMNKSDPIWGVADYRKEMEGEDKETLEDLEF